MEENQRKNRNRVVLAFIMIGIGMIAFLRQIGIYYDLPHFPFHSFFCPVRAFFSNWGAFIFSWQVILIGVGIILVTGKRPAGIFMIVIGGIFLLPEIFLFPPFSLTILLPALLIGVGVVMVIRFF